jgi:hypothetical protein
MATVATLSNKLFTFRISLGKSKAHLPSDFPCGYYHKFWIQVDHTPTGVGLDLEDAGIPKNRILLGFILLSIGGMGSMRWNMDSSG